MAVKAFPSAYGYGTSSNVGGRGGTVLFIDNLNDSGAGSARAAFEASGARIIIPRVGGTVTLSSAITISNPYCTYAGQVAPGGGLYFDGVHSGGSDTHIRIHTHNVILRHLRIRAYDSGAVPIWESTPMLIWGSTNPVYNVTLDHCTICWATDENLDVFGDAYDVTIQWCLIADARITGDPDGPAPTYTAPSSATLFGSGVTNAQAFTLSFHHNVVANCKQRGPLFNPFFTTVAGSAPWATFDCRNNLFSTWNGNNWSTFAKYHYGVGKYNDWLAAFPSTPHAVSNWVGNHWIKGSTGVSANDVLTVGPHTQTYMANNLGPAALTVPVDDFDIQVTHNAKRYSGDTLSPYFFHHGFWDNTGFVAATPFSTPSILEHDATEVHDLLTQNAGATLPSKDSQWTDIMNAVIANNSVFGDKTNAPTLASGTYPTHSQPDGIPDSWKVDNGLSVGTDYTGVISPNDYDWVENYINDTAGDTVPDFSSTVPPSITMMPTYTGEENTPVAISDLTVVDADSDAKKAYINVSSTATLSITAGAATVKGDN